MSRHRGKKKFKEHTEPDREEHRRLLEFLQRDSPGITMAPPGSLKREATESPPLEKKMAPKRARSDQSTASSSTLALKTLFGLLLEQPEHELYAQNVQHLVGEALDTRALHSAALAPLQHLLQTAEQRCSGNSHWEKALLANLQKAYIDRLLGEIAACVSSTSGLTSHKSAVSFNGEAQVVKLEITVAPLLDVEDGEHSRVSAQPPTGFQDASLVPAVGDLLRGLSMQPDARDGSTIVDTTESSAESDHVHSPQGSKGKDGVFVKQEEGPESDGTGGTDDDVVVVMDVSQDVDRCQCLRSQLITRIPPMYRLELKLVVQSISGDDSSARLPHHTVDTAMRSILPSHLCYTGMAKYDENSTAVCFKNERCALKAAGFQVRILGKAFTLARIEDAPSRVLLCTTIPLRAAGVDESSMLHGLLHILSGQRYLHVKATSTPQSTDPDQSNGVVLVLLHSEEAIKKFSFDVPLHGSAGAHRRFFNTVFTAVDVINTLACRVCNSNAHGTIECPTLKPIVLKTTKGPHRRLLRAAPPQ